LLDPFLRELREFLESILVISVGIGGASVEDHLKKSISFITWENLVII
jgi:hypothetical protein